MAELPEPLWPDDDDDTADDAEFEEAERAWEREQEEHEAEVRAWLREGRALDRETAQAEAAMAERMRDDKPFMFRRAWATARYCARADADLIVPWQGPWWEGQAAERRRREADESWEADIRSIEAEAAEAADRRRLADEAFIFYRAWSNASAFAGCDADLRCPW